eukprot:CAMPEP_0171256242 /NCGR_PEP_ID=MMETSP0790-20130122/53197_1 /TAXON_ID=2925 /ORGANISM="Alexandrium catenella, Strain OF101" /LENGTH=79 /DNA_ID=CAMNT_0011724251 /DNA_START=114 /DNA_END=349 /DNA_ORIENTATION=-
MKGGHMHGIALPGRIGPPWQTCPSQQVYLRWNAAGLATSKASRHGQQERCTQRGQGRGTVGKGRAPPSTVLVRASVASV